MIWQLTAAVMVVVSTVAMMLLVAEGERELAVHEREEYEP